MFTPVGKIGNQYQMRDDATGQVWPVSEQIANEMMSSGSVKPGLTLNNDMGGGGGGHPDMARISNAWQNPQPMVPAAQPAPTPQAVDPAAEAQRRARVAPMQRGESAPMSAQAAPSPKLQLTPVPPSKGRQQSQQQAPQGYDGPPLVETVRTPGSRAQWQNQSQSRSGIDQELQDDLMALELDNRRKGLEANSAMYETMVQREQANSLNAQRERKMAEQELIRKREEDSERNVYAQGVTQKLQQEVEEVRTQKLNTWHQDVGMGGTILAAVSMAMGAYAQGINGGQNTAADIINRAIERDTQKKLGEKADRLDSAQQRLRNSMTEFGFRADQRKKYMTALGQQQAAAYLKQQAADKELAFAHPTMLQNAAALEAQSNQTLTELAKTAQYNATERWVPASVGRFVTRLTPEGERRKLMAGLTGDEAEAAKKSADAATAISASSDGTVKKGDIMYGGTKLGRIEDETLSRELNTALRQYGEVEENGIKLLDLVKNGSALSPTQKAEANTRRNALVKYLKSTGENSDADAARIMEGIGDGMDTWSKANSRALETTLAIKRSERDGYIRQYGLQQPKGLAGKPLRATDEGFD